MIPTHIRRATAADASAILDLEARFPVADRISRQSLLRMLRSDSCDCIVAQRRTVLGAAIVLYREGQTAARLYSIAVHHTAMGTGIGRALIDAAIEAAGERDCDRIRLEVRVSNESAIALYSRAGFVPFDRKVAYYDDGEDAVRMERFLPSTQEQKA